MADITTDQRYENVTLVIKNIHGNPAPVDGVPVWASSDETVLALTIADDGMSALKIDTVAPGTARVTVTADADLGAGVKTITGFKDVEVGEGESFQASVFEFNFPAPVAKV
jgi:hypothetical protein